MIPSRADEVSRIVANWIRRAGAILGPPGSALFREALAAAGLDAIRLAGGSGLQHRHFDALMRHLERSQPDITLRVISTTNLLELGLLGYAALSAGTVGRGMDLLLRFLDLTSDRYSEERLRRGAMVLIRPVPRLRHLANLQSIAEDCLAGNWTAIRLLAGPGIVARQVTAAFAYPEPRWVDAYHEAFGCNLVFDAEHSELQFPASWLELPVASGNLAMSEVTSSICDRLLGTDRAARQDVVGAVRRLLISRPRQRMPRLEEAAGDLHLSAAQLRKRFYKVGTTYKRVVLEVRMALAWHYLTSTSLSVQDVAYLLDYAQPAPFSRAFKAFHGVSPIGCRQRGVPHQSPG